jgi:hypothetical protein
VEEKRMISKSNVYDFVKKKKEKEMRKIKNNKPVKFSEMSEKDRRESIEAMKDED